MGKRLKFGDTGMTNMIVPKAPNKPNRPNPIFFGALSPAIHQLG